MSSILSIFFKTQGLPVVVYPTISLVQFQKKKKSIPHYPAALYLMCELPKFIASNVYGSLVAFTSPCMDMSGFGSFKYFRTVIFCITTPWLNLVQFYIKKVLDMLCYCEVFLDFGAP